MVNSREHDRDFYQDRHDMDKQIDILEAIDDNDIMEHAYSQITPEEC